jgi:hypothetical protein
MKLFSERMGFRPAEKVFQIDSMSDDLRTGLWNILISVYWNYNDSTDSYRYYNPRLRHLIEGLWDQLLKKNLDDLPDDWKNAYRLVKVHFFACNWDEVYSFIEYVVNEFPYYPHVTYDEFDLSDKYDILRSRCNEVLKREISGYRLVEFRTGETYVGSESMFIPLTNEQELVEITEVLELQGKLRPVSKRFRRAIELFSDRKSPDYRNSINESISAVEAMCNIISGKKNKGLGSALGEIERTKKVEVHKALKGGFEKIYGWTSDANGIRHPMMEMSNVDFEDAKFMLVSCSAFINYLKEKAIKAGIGIE